MMPEGRDQARGPAAKARWSWPGRGSGHRRPSPDGGMKASRFRRLRRPYRDRGRQWTLSLLAAIVLICAFGLVLAVTHHAFAAS
jgi:hypothetical protein